MLLSVVTKKTDFFRAFANWIEEWDAMKLPNSEKIRLSAQTSNALRRTLMHSLSIINNLLSEGYKYVLTASDPLEHIYAQYRQMCRGRFLVSLKDVVTSEKILKIPNAKPKSPTRFTIIALIAALFA